MDCNRSFVLGFKGAEEISAQQMADRLTRRGLEMLPVRVWPEATGAPAAEKPLEKSHVLSPLLKGETVAVVHMATQDACSTTSLYCSADRTASWQSPPFQLAAVDPMNRPPKTSPTDIIGLRWAIASELRTATESSHTNGPTNSPNWVEPERGSPPVCPRILKPDDPAVLRLELVRNWDLCSPVDY